MKAMAGQVIQKTNLQWDTHWKYVEAFIQWGFKEGTEKSDFDGHLETTFGYGMLGKIRAVPGDSATTVLDKASWKSAPSDGRTTWDPCADFVL